MYKILTALVLTASLAGCATAPRDRVVGVVSTEARTERVTVAQPASVTQASTQQMRKAATNPPPTANPDPRSDLARLKPGAAYVASFPEAERRAACVRLNYTEGTAQFSRCLEGDFPENPYFRG